MMADEREWQAQERAKQLERDGLECPDADNLTAGYLSIARALRQPIDVGLPSDFAERIDRLVAAQARPAAGETRFELGMLVALALAMGIAALVVMLLYGSNWMAPVADALGHVARPTLRWSVAVLLCLAISWLAEQLRRYPKHPGRHRA